jgi:hypothetical protein
MPFSRSQFFPKRNKFNAKKTEIDGQTFDSQLEARFYTKYLAPLALQEEWEVKRQVKFNLEVNGSKVCEYIADYLITKKDGLQQVFECKGMMLNDALIKLRLFEAIFKIPVFVARSLSSIEKLKGYKKRK